MNNWTIEAHLNSDGHWDYITFAGLPAPSLWRFARTRWQFNVHGHSFAVYSAWDILMATTAARMVDHHFEPSTDRLSVDLSMYQGYAGRSGGVK